MDASTLEQINTIMRIPGLVSWVLLAVVGVAGIAGAVFAATTRPDAFEATGRQSKAAWTAILAVSAVACLLRLPFIAWFGAVAIGIYFFDVRPQIKQVIDDSYGW